MNIHFKKVTHEHQKIIFDWLQEPHMLEFWDNSQEHKDDILNFINGRIEPSNYFNGIFTYWIGYLDDQPFSFILTSEVVPTEDLPPLLHEHLSQTGKTCGLDFGIGNKDFIGKGLASATLIAFTDFFHKSIDPETDTFYIDPNDDNPRAHHVYEKAGFNLVGTYNSKGKHWEFSSDGVCLMVKKLCS